MAAFRENTAAALRALRESWVRSALTILGITIGVGSVVLLVSIGQGVKADVTRQMESLGANVLFVLPGHLDRRGNPDFMSTLGISTLTDADVDSLRRVPGVARSIPLMFVFGAIERAGGQHSAVVLASTPEIHDIRRRPFEEGRFFTEAERQQRVCVLAHDPKEAAFGSAPAVGRDVRIRGVQFRVVGVLVREEESVFGPGFFANSVYIPIDTARAAFRGGQVNRIVVQTDYRADPDVVVERVRATLRANHGGREDFAILTQRQLLSALYRVFNIVTALLAGISAISLVVAGIGIMNIMLVTVTERTREIGIRKTVGARRADIFAQFLTEAVALSFTGGAIGTLLAAGVCAVLAAATPLKPLVTPGAILLAFGVCFAVGLLFGVAPAMRAARQNPIDALRWE